jgi:hypothetical protein
MNFEKLDTLVRKSGHRLSPTKLNFVGLRVKDSTPNQFDDSFIAGFKPPRIYPEKFEDITYVEAFQKIYNVLCIYDGYMGVVTVDGDYGPETQKAYLYYLNCFYRKGHWTKMYEITTISGIPYLLKPLNKAGAAVLMPGAWKYKRGRHKDQQAFVQAEYVSVYRDNDKDLIAEVTNLVQKGFFGINIHRRRFGLLSDLVNKWSAGCQVFRFGNEFQEIIYLADAFAVLQEQKEFTYYLLDA